MTIIYSANITFFCNLQNIFYNSFLLVLMLNEKHSKNSCDAFDYIMLEEFGCLTIFYYANYNVKLLFCIKIAFNS